METQTLADILSPGVICVAPTTLVSDAMNQMRSNNISCVIVQDNDRPVGIVTERNMVSFIVGHWNDMHDQQVHEIMSSPVVTARREIDMFSAYSLLAEQELRHLVVVDANDSLFGVVTLSDIVEHISYEYFVEIKEVSQVMTRIVKTVDQNVPLQKALTEMATKSISCVVIAENRLPIGIITERDASHIVLEHTDGEELTVGEVMSSPLQTVQEDMSLPDVIALMKKKKLRRLVVVDSEGNIAGLTTQSDIVKGLEGKYIQALGKIIKEKDSVIQKKSRDLDTKTIYLDNILQSSIDHGIIAIDLDYCIIYFNPGAETILGMSADKLLGQDVRKLHQSNNSLSQFEDIVEAILWGERPSFVIKRETPEGTQYINARASGIFDKSKKTIGFFLMVNDITKRKCAERELKKAHEELEHRVAERTKQLSNAMNGAIEAMALTVEMRDPYTSGHQRRVADLAAAIARKMNLSADKIEGVYMAGLVHDIGKIRVPSGILCHPGLLSEAEFGLLKPHPSVGYDILKGIEFPWPIADVVQQHHERLDGSGYPQGLKDDQILLKSKIVSVADVVEAMSSHRPYRPALGIEKALSEISDKKGIHYDSDAVDACLELFQEKNYEFPPHFRE